MLVRTSLALLAAGALLTSRGSASLQADDPEPPAADAPLPIRVNAAVDRGVAHLLETQRLEGDWAWGNGVRIGATALAGYALVKSGLDAKHNAVQRALASLEGAKPGQTYDRACLILFLSSLRDPELRPRIAELAELLVRSQTGGVWGYPSGHPDLSNTQYAVMGLWAAQKAGAEVPASCWRKLAKALPKYERSDGFSYRPGGNPTSSMTTAGVACAALCEMYADFGDDRRPTSSVKRLVSLRDEGLDWLGRRAVLRYVRGEGIGRVGYELYGLERACSLAGAATVHGHDWYEIGAEYILGEQQESGGWPPLYGEPLGTAFALLFLRRATAARAPISGPTSRRKESDLGPDAPWLVELASDRRHDLLRSLSPRVTASTALGAHGHARLTDGDQRTFWRSEPTDEDPRLTIDFGRPIKADTIAFGHPYLPDVAPGTHPRALLVSVSIDDKGPLLVPMRPEAERRGRLRLPRPIEMRRIELSFPKRMKASDGSGGVALGEIQVLLRRR